MIDIIIIIIAFICIALLLFISWLYRIVQKDNLETAKEDAERNMNVAEVKKELSKFISVHGLDNEFETPAFILTEYIWNCLIMSKTK